MALQVRKQTSPTLRNLSILLYGIPKTGKTTAAAQFPNAVLLNCEPGGTDLLAGEHDVVDIDNLAHLEKMVPQIVKSEYRAVVIDGFTWLVNQAVREYIKRNKPKDRRRAYGDVGDMASRIMADLLMSGKVVVATGHSRLVDVEDENDPKNDEKVEVRPDVNPRLSDAIFGLFGVIAYCFPTGNGSQMLTKPKDDSRRRIVAGDRSGALPNVMPLDAGELMVRLRDAAKPQVDASEPEGNGAKIAA